jgi:hypothetical protein
MFYNTNSGRRPLGKPKRRWIAEAEENSRKVLSVRHWKEKLSVNKVWRSYKQESRAKYLLRHSTGKQEGDTLFTLTLPANNVYVYVELCVSV